MTGGEPLFRSVNIREDVGHPSRLAHYHPTGRSVPVLGAVMSRSSTMVIASYGSGKSLAAGLGLVAVANDPADRAFLVSMSERVIGIDPVLGSAIADRVESGIRGRTAVLSGYERDPVSSLSAALGTGPSKSVRGIMNAIGRMEGVDHVAIVWDEFGRHLEGLVAEGRSRDLAMLQELAELAVRSEGPTVSLTLLLHQNVLAYASTLNQTSRSEWKKVEGRFEQVRFVEDSRQIYALIASAVAARRPRAVENPRSFVSSAKAAVTAGWFDGLTDMKSVENLLRTAAPLSAAALHVLPSLTARVGQNERSLFSFIENVDLESPVGMEEVYHAFGDAIRSDVGPGGLHRRWVEAEGALSRTESEVERELVCAAFLLQAGATGERRRLRRSALEAAAVSDGHAPDAVAKAFDSLSSRKLLIHRKLNDDVSVWHGADVDVAGRLRDERLRLAVSFDLASFLSRVHPAPFVKPVRHNAMWGTSRYIEGAYVTAAGLEKALEEPVTGWGRALYVTCQTAGDVRAATEVASRDHGRQVIVIPDEPLQAADAALEVAALEALKASGELADEDPLAERELDELLAVARGQLAASLHRLVTQRPVAASWHSAGRRLDVSSDRPANVAVSDLMDRWFPRTPLIVNDQMVRTRLSRQMTTARIRLVTRLMDRAAEPGLGYLQDDGSAEASIYRTVLARTGIHRTEGASARFASPEELVDPGLRAAWEAVRDFFTVPGKRALPDIVETLSSPPLGLARGVLPVIVLAGYRAFARAAWFRSGGAFVPDVMGFASTRMFEDDEVLHEVEVAPQDEATMAYLDGICRIFGMREAGPLEEKVTVASQALGRWLGTVADGARRSRRMPRQARDLLRLLSNGHDFPDVLFNGLPDLLAGDSPDRLPATVKAAEAARDAIDGLVDGYLRDAVETMGEAIGMGKGDPLSRVQAWASCFDVESLLRRRDLKLTDQTILRTVRESVEGRYTAEGLARVMSSVLLQRGVEKWQDDTRSLLRRELRDARERIEAAALDSDEPAHGLEPVIRAKIDRLEAMLRRLRGQRGKGER